jgi:hypothetical protein
MRSIYAVLLLVFGIAQQSFGQSGCLPADSTALYFRSFAREFVTRTDPDGVSTRNSSIFRPTDSTKVVLVSSAATCTKVVSGFNANRGTPGMARRLHVVDMNKQGYFIFEPIPPPAIPNTSWAIAFSMTKTFAVRTIFIW